MSWGEGEIGECTHSRAERGRLARELEGKRGGPRGERTHGWKECKICGKRDLDINDYCYKCHSFFCIEHFGNHICDCENGVEP